MFLEVDLHSSKPVYQQLVDQVKHAVASGRLREGDKLPSIRDVAVAVRVNRNTVARVYTELEREGIVTMRPGQGCFVTARDSQLSLEVRRGQVTERLDELLAQARLYGLTREEVLDLVNERILAFYDGHSGRKQEAGR
ncbi:MAG: GntR family transcriptional regulator [Candidatus Sumerlaeia bacterium]|nr:GntR family transcriptional regulator [Candidatus Sumerlaeia bacterium]